MTLKEGGRILLVTLSLFSRTLAEKCSDIHFKGIKSSKVRESTFPRAHISFRFIALPVWLMFGVWAEGRMSCLRTLRKQNPTTRDNGFFILYPQHFLGWHFQSSFCPFANWKFIQLEKCLFWNIFVWKINLRGGNRNNAGKSIWNPTCESFGLFLSRFPYLILKRLFQKNYSLL